MKYLYHPSFNKAFEFQPVLVQKHSIVETKTNDGRRAFFRRLDHYGYNYFEQLFRLAEITVFGDSKIEFSQITEEDYKYFWRYRPSFQANKEIARYAKKKVLADVAEIVSINSGYLRFSDLLDAVSIYHSFSHLCPMQEDRKFKIVDDKFLEENPHIEKVVVKRLPEEEVKKELKRLLGLD